MTAWEKMSGIYSWLLHRPESFTKTSLLWAQGYQKAAMLPRDI